jgi:hypothetical protein
MNHHFDNKHLLTEDPIHVDPGGMSQDMEATDPWNDVDDLKAYYAPAPEFIQQHDLANILGRSLDV